MPYPKGKPAPNRKDPAARLRDNSIQVGDCRLWTGHKNSSGYGRMTIYDPSRTYRHRLVSAHRYAYALSQGIDYDDLPPAMEIDHLCRTRSCINPDHLELVRPSENVNRSLNARHVQRHERRVNKGRMPKQPCDNHVLVANGRQQHCRECDRRNQRRYRERVAAK